MVILLFMSECNHRSWYKKCWDTFNYYSFIIYELLKEEFMIKFHSSELKISTNQVNISVSKNYWTSKHSLLLTEPFYWIDKNYPDNFISSYGYLTILLTQSLTNISPVVIKNAFIFLFTCFNILLPYAYLCHVKNSMYTIFSNFPVCFMTSPSTSLILITHFIPDFT